MTTPAAHGSARGSQQRTYTTLPLESETVAKQGARVSARVPIEAVAQELRARVHIEAGRKSECKRKPMAAPSQQVPR